MSGDDDRPDVNPALVDLQVLVGTWEMELSNAAFLSDPSAKANGQVSFEWIEGGDFLMMRQGEKVAGSQYATRIIGRDESEEDYMVLYIDDRGVSRVYSMSFDGREWRQWREALGFSQRFEGTISSDGNTLRASWEKSTDAAEWEHDFDLTFTRKNAVPRR